MKIYLDFDGTVVEHQYPEIGHINLGCMEIIKKLQNTGHEIVLNTFRADCDDGTLQQAFSIFENAWLYTIDKNEDFKLNPIVPVEEKINPFIFDIKLFKKNNVIFIDDRCVGIPLKKANKSEGWMVDWQELEIQFQENGIL